MRYFLISLATRWGRSEGGNVFNKDLVSAIADSMSTEAKCICLTKSGSDISDKKDVEVIQYRHFDAPLETAEQIRDLIQRDASSQISQIIILGHDVHTGGLAIDTCHELRKLVRFDTKSAIIRHMHYHQYAQYKGTPPPEAILRAEKQTRLVEEADIVFAVGHFLKANAQGSSKKNVCALVPGAPKVKISPLEKEAPWQIYMSGRLGSDDDRIKNTTLAIEGLIAGYEQARQVGGSAAERFESRGRFHLVGTDPKGNKLEAYRERNGPLFEIDPVPYSDDPDVLKSALARSHWAVMPSWHEGFGLSGWEAICAGVPLICSRHSGLYNFLQNHVFLKNVEVPKDGIVTLTLSGSAYGAPPSPADIKSVAAAVIELTGEYDRRKAASVKLALFLQENYTWARCAREFLDHLNWVLPSSVKWKDRQTIADKRVLDEPLDDSLIKSALNIAGEGLIFDEWETICSAFNILSRWGKVDKGTAAHRALNHLKAFSNSLETTLPVRIGHRGVKTRQTGDLDVIWRYLGAASSVAPTFAAFNSLIRPVLWQEIVKDSFLLREFLFYSCRFDFEADGEPDEAIISRLTSLGEQILDAALQQRLGRLAARNNTFRTAIDGAGILARLPVAQLTLNHAEAILRKPQLAGAYIAQDPQMSGTCVWLISEGLLQSFHGPRLTIDFVEETQGAAFVTRRWRGDKRYDLVALIGSLPAASVLPVLRGLADDEDEAIRWACLDLAFSTALRGRSDIKQGLPYADVRAKKLNEDLGKIVDLAVFHDGSHPWLQREFLDLFSREMVRTKDLNRRFTLEDFPLSRTLLGRSVRGRRSALVLHPEVEEFKRSALERSKRVLLVLPPIERDERAHAASRTNTPPLGLGLIATALLRAGHDVELVDCHRFPELIDNIADVADDFDWIGFNVVLSTVRPTLQIAAEIRERTTKPYLVVGGPVVNMGAWHSAASSESRSVWDFAIEGIREETLSELIEASRTDGPWRQVIGVSANVQNELLWETHCSEWSSNLHPADKGIPPANWALTESVDRRIFMGQSHIYEPAKTRRLSQDAVEAHVVMSRGCNWRCTFCTERFQLSRGERRRPVTSVLEELSYLAGDHPNLRIQFIDDNLLPQIASAPTNRVAVAQGVDWTTDFLDGLKKIRKAPNSEFGWRGIFRFDDFIMYEKEFDTAFIGMLKESGCRMLAFGIEQGSEDRRQRTKQSKLTNEDVVDVLSRLKDAGIATKGYFILGGGHETVDSASETIEFALSCGVSLAYFAIYKDFVKAAHELQNNAVDAASAAEQYLSYKQLWLDLDTMFAETSNELAPVSRPLPATVFHESEGIRGIMGEVYSQLKELGFNFSDLVKYNDYHSDEGSSAKVLDKNTFKNSELYFDTLRSAYLRFYLRPKFVGEYERLVSDGY